MEQNDQSTTTPQSGQTEPQSSQPAASAAQISKDEKTMAMLCHLLGLLTSFLGPLIIWLIKKDQSTYVDQQGKEALNFQITMAIAWFVAGLSTAICIGVVLLPVVGIANLVLSIMACVAANKGEPYRYPVSLRLVK